MNGDVRRSDVEWFNKLSAKFPIGCSVKALLYNLRHKGVYDPQICKVSRLTTPDEIAQGYRPGVIVIYDNKEYWVLPEDCTRV